jgi:hypothetical protein
VSTTNATADMLRMLGSSGNAPALNPGSRAGKADIASAGFADLLKLAKDGEVSSGREVSIDPGLKIDLTPEQRTALSAAADRAEAAGLNKALVMIGGHGLVLDVASRTVTGSADLSNPSVLGQIDGVVNAGGKGAQAGAPLMPPVNPVGNLSLAHLLAQSAPKPGTDR